MRTTLQHGFHNVIQYTYGFPAVLEKEVVETAMLMKHGMLGELRQSQPVFAIS